MSEIKVVYEPRKRVVIHEYIKYGNPEEFLRSVAGPPPLGVTLVAQWTEGVLFTFAPFTQTETVVRELIAGTIHWDHVSFAPMPKYQSKIMADGIVCNVSDVSSNAVFRAIAKFLKHEFFK
jgi:hypothetical protein